MPRTSPGLVALAACPGLFACASSPTSAPEPLPFHLAVVPVDIESEQPGDDGPGIREVFDFKQVEVTNALCEALEDRFTRVTQILPPDMERLDQFDLVLYPTLRQVDRIATKTNDRLYPNLLLFLLGGPFGWFVPDRTYEFETELVAEFVDPALSEEMSTMDRPGPMILRLECESRKGSLNFLSRADGIADYILSCIVPAGFLARGGSEVREELEDLALSQITDRLVDRIEGDRNQLLQPLTAGVDFRPAHLQIVEKSGGPHLEGEVWLELGRTLGLASLTVSYDDGTAEAPVDLSACEDQTTTYFLAGNNRDIARYVIDVPLANRPVDSKQLRIEIVDTSTRGTKRRLRFEERRLREAGYHLTQRKLRPGSRAQDAPFRRTEEARPVPANAAGSSPTETTEPDSAPLEPDLSETDDGSD